MPVETKDIRKVLVLYTGGTIGMQKNENGGKFFDLFVFKIFLKKFNMETPDYFASIIFELYVIFDKN